MEPILREHLIRLMQAYCAATQTSVSTVAQAACGDWRFFDRVGEAPAASFRIRTYDRAKQWFSDHWPTLEPWPVEVGPRPMPGARAATITEAA